MEKVKAWIAVIVGLVVGLFVFTHFSLEGFLWEGEQEETVSEKELEENPSETFIGRPASEDVKQITSKEEFENMTPSVETASASPKSIVSTGVYSLGKWSDVYTKRRNGTSWRRKSEVLTSDFLAGLWGEYSQYYLIELEDGNYILAQMNACVAKEIAKGKETRLPVGHKIGFSQEAKNELTDICQEYGADTQYVFYAIDDTWQEENSFLLFISRAAVAVVCFLVVAVVLLLLLGKIMGGQTEEN